MDIFYKKILKENADFIVLYKYYIFVDFCLIKSPQSLHDLYFQKVVRHSDMQVFWMYFNKCFLWKVSSRNPQLTTALKAPPPLRLQGDYKAFPSNLFSQYFCTNLTFEI